MRSKNHLASMATTVEHATSRATSYPTSCESRWEEPELQTNGVGLNRFCFISDHGKATKWPMILSAVKRKLNCFIVVQDQQTEYI